ncbi:MAG: phosphopantetheine-binding protein [Solirubrobacteraceae bacterium]|nr:phosphopantetheine-binding protein [Solirubrobacteraceae bacterium]
MTAAPLPPLPQDIDSLRAAVAALLDADLGALGDDADLLDAGLDSIRVMALAEHWSAAGVELTFMDLVEAPTLTSWWAVVADARARA